MYRPGSFEEETTHVLQKQRQEAEEEMNGLLGDPQAPQMPGSGMAKMAADDIQLRPLWIQTQERMAMGEHPQMDYDTWKRHIMQQMQQLQQQQPQPQQPMPQQAQAQSLI